MVDISQWRPHYVPAGATNGATGALLSATKARRIDGWADPHPPHQFWTMLPDTLAKKGGRIELGCVTRTNEYGDNVATL